MEHDQGWLDEDTPEVLHERFVLNVWWRPLAGYGASGCYLGLVAAAEYPSAEPGGTHIRR